MENLPFDYRRVISLPGVENYTEAMNRSRLLELDAELAIRLISARDLLECQLALPEIYQKPERIKYLRGVLDSER